jgi:RNA polymerase-binding transcription factor DksA
MAKKSKKAPAKSAKKPAKKVSRPAPKKSAPQPKKSAPKKAAKPAPKAAKEKPKAAAKGKPAPAPSKNGHASAKADAGKKSKVPAPIPPPKPIRGINPDEVIQEPVGKRPPLPAAYLKKQKQRLLELRSHLSEAMEGVAMDSLRSRPEGSEASVGGMHMGDAGSDAYERDFALSLLSKEQDALYEINEALRRIDLRTYGYCEMTGKKISEERLDALPFTRFTREAQEMIEQSQIGGRSRRAPVRSVFSLDDESEEEGDEEGEEEGSSSNSNNNNQSESSLDFMKE